MDISAIQGALDGTSAAKARQADIHGFTMRVQTAVGPKHLSGHGLQGRVVVAYSVSEDGSLQGARIAQSSGEHRLDSEAMQILGRAVFPSPPSGLGVSHRTFISAFTFD